MQTDPSETDLLDPSNELPVEDFAEISLADELDTDEAARATLSAPVAALYTALDPDQRALVDLPSDALATVNANAGSGKTHALIVRAAHLSVLRQVSPRQQVLITFTNKAAQEIKDRWHSMLAPHMSDGARKQFGTPWISTIHRFGLHLLMDVFGFNRTVLTESRSRKLMRNLASLDGEVVDHARFADAIDNLYSQNELHLFVWPEFRPDGTLVKVHNIAAGDEPDAYKAACKVLDPLTASCVWTTITHGVRELGEEKKQELRGHHAAKAGLSAEAFGKALVEYMQVKITAGSLDYSDMLYQPLLYLAQFESARTTLRGRYTHFMMDEAQDCAPIDHALMRVVGGNSPNYVLVGDTKQTLYNWRGAAPHVVDYLDRVYPDKTVSFGKLTHNYRSTAQLVTLANTFAKEFDRRSLNDSKAVKPPARDSLSILTFDTVIKENAWIATDIKRTIVERKDLTYSDCTILTRTNRSLTELEATMIAHGIPYKLKVDTRRVSQSPAFSLLHGLYSLWLNPRDVVSLMAIIQNLHGIGPKKVLAIRDAFSPLLLSDPDASLADLSVGDKNTAFLKPFLDNLVTPFSRKHADTPVPALNLELLDFLSMQKWGDRNQSPPEYMPKPELSFTLDWANMDRMLQLVDLVYRLHANEEDFAALTHTQQLHQVHAALALTQEATTADEADLKDDKPRVTLSTVHAFKGRQGKRIYYAHLNRLSAIAPSDEDDERCAFYVAITRAQEKLILTASSKAHGYDGRLITTYPNPFLREYVAAVKKLLPAK